MIHHPIDAARMLREAGWTNSRNREIALAVCIAESALDDQARNENLVGGVVDSVDLGLMQINSKWQPQVSAECALDPVCNLAEAYKIYTGRGHTFSACNAWRDGAHRKHLPLAAVAVEAEVRLRQLDRFRLEQVEGLRDEVALWAERYTGAQERMVAAQANYDREAAKVRALIFG